MVGMGSWKLPTCSTSGVVLLVMLGFLASTCASPPPPAVPAAPPSPETPPPPPASQTQEEEALEPVPEDDSEGLGEEAVPPAGAPVPMEAERKAEDQGLQSGRDELGEALAAFRKAELRFDAATEQAPLRAASPASGAEDSASGAAPKKRAKPSATEPARDCTNACRAFASLERAQAGICHIDGDSGAHCQKAKRTVEQKRQRLRPCTC